MTPLLQHASDAHGGLERWKELRTIVVTASMTGAIWAIKCQTDYLADAVLRLDTQRQRMATGFPGQTKRLTFARMFLSRRLRTRPRTCAREHRREPSNSRSAGSERISRYADEPLSPSFPASSIQEDIVHE
jgi:hypothetical protein